MVHLQKSGQRWGHLSLRASSFRVCNSCPAETCSVNAGRTGRNGNAETENLDLQTHFMAHEGILLVIDSPAPRHFETWQTEYAFVIGVLRHLKNKQADTVTFLRYHYCEYMLLH